ncbi:uncharacterized protein L3040_001708 [Drepanopeziza brunnea f. sp. 'multigermtubi']|uniref:uncharacterized protein n=1 Tax=Drepanopeziza brunnea f. sp. 'multigermtubi' TaxID=698441 RepID=UPI0023850C7B|nr:hypothetical protein L3040_001708 [Drepanopeziza brunnea f. sp. 'multigermtubi']
MARTPEQAAEQQPRAALRHQLLSQTVITVEQKRTNEDENIDDTAWATFLSLYLNSSQPKNYKWSSSMSELLSNQEPRRICITAHLRFSHAKNCTFTDLVEPPQSCRLSLESQVLSRRNHATAAAVWLGSSSATNSGYEYIKDAEAYVFEKLKFALIMSVVHIEIKYKSNNEIHGGSEGSHIGNNRVFLFFLEEFFANIED